MLNFRSLIRVVVVSLALLLATPAWSRATDIIIILDNSGSMLQSDPKELRVDSSLLIFNLIDDESYFGIIEFGSEARVLVPLTPRSRLTTGSIDKALWDSMKKMHSRSSKQKNFRNKTDYNSAVEAAAAEFEKNGRDFSRKAVIMLSDGDIDPNPDDPRYLGTDYQQALQKFTNKDTALKQVAITQLEQFLTQQWSGSDNHVSLFTIGLSDQDQFSLLRKMSMLTNGDSFWISSTAELEEYFLRTFGLAESNYEFPLNGSVTIPEGVEELILVLRDVKGKEYSIRRDSLRGPDVTKNFTASESGNNVILKMKSPWPGTYYLLPEDLPGSGFVQIMAFPRLIDLKQVYPLNATLDLQALFMDDKANPITDPQLLGNSRLMVTVQGPDNITRTLPLRDNGAVGDQKARDYIWTARIEGLDQPGQYRFVVNGVLDLQGKEVATPKDYRFTTVLNVSLQLQKEKAAKPIRNLQAHTVFFTDQEGRVINEPAWLSSCRFRLQSLSRDQVQTYELYDDGDDRLHGDVKPGDGKFSARVDTSQKGEYELRVMASCPQYKDPIDSGKVSVWYTTLCSGAIAWMIDFVLRNLYRLIIFIVGGGGVALVIGLYHGKIGEFCRRCFKPKEKPTLQGRLEFLETPLDQSRLAGTEIDLSISNSNLMLIGLSDHNQHPHKYHLEGDPSQLDNLHVEISVDKEGSMFVAPVMKSKLLVNGVVTTGKVPLFDGNDLEFGGYKLAYHEQ